MMLTAYLNHLRLAGRRPETVATVARVFAALRPYLDGPPERATRYQLEAFLARNLSLATRKAYRSHLRGFYTWLILEGERNDDPTSRLPAVRLPRGVPRPIADDDLRHALDSAPARMRAWLLLMSLGGLRCCEVARLRPEDLHSGPHGTMLYLREAKGGGTGYVPAHPAVLDALARLPVIERRWWSLAPITVSQQVSAYLRSISVDATAHQLRHYAATAWYRESGHDLLTTARLLRHASVSTTEVYARIDPERPTAVVRLVPVP